MITLARVLNCGETRPFEMRETTNSVLLGENIEFALTIEKGGGLVGKQPVVVMKASEAEHALTLERAHEDESRVIFHFVYDFKAHSDHELRVLSDDTHPISLAQFRFSVSKHLSLKTRISSDPQRHQFVFIEAQVQNQYIVPMQVISIDFQCSPSFSLFDATSHRSSVTLKRLETFQYIFCGQVNGSDRQLGKIVFEWSDLDQRRGSLQTSLLAYSP